MLQRVRDLKVQFDNGTLSTDDQDAIAAEVFQIAQRDQGHHDRHEVQRHGRVRRRRDVHLPGRRQRLRDDRDDRRATSRRSAPPAPAACTSSRRSTDAAATKTALDTRRRSSTVSTVDNAIKNVSKARANFGAVQNRLEHRLNNLATYQENLTASESRIRDVDMAAEMTKFTKLNILQQAGTSMLAQANQAPQGVLSLLR